MRRFLIAPLSPGQTTVHLGREESHHLARVLRLKEGAEIELFDGQGMVYQAAITAMAASVQVAIQTSRPCHAPLPRLHLHLGLLKGKKMDFIIQKATELGVHTLAPFSSAFTEAAPPKEQKKERWQKISLEACKQCGRNWPLLIEEPAPLTSQVQALPPEAVALLCWEDELQQDPGALALPASLDDLHLFIGPEGGFSPAEVALCRHRMAAVTLGPLTLRAETAVITALSLALFLTGRMKHH